MGFLLLVNPTVQFEMAGQVTQGDEAFMADGTLERPLTAVQQPVPFQVALVSEELATLCALVGLLTSVH